MVFQRGKKYLSAILGLSLENAIRDFLAKNLKARVFRISLIFKVLEALRVVAFKSAEGVVESFSDLRLLQLNRPETEDCVSRNGKE